MDMGSPPQAMARRKRYTHMTFFWGKNSEILFEMWPGTRGGHYALALIVCFVLALLVEWLSFCGLARPGWSRTTVGLTRIVTHTIRVGLAYLVMLAVMSFNGGVFIVIVAGHAVGFMLFGCPRKKDGENQATRDCCEGCDLPPMKC